MMFRKLLAVAVLTTLFSFALGNTDTEAGSYRRVYRSPSYGRTYHYGYGNRSHTYGNRSYGYGNRGYGYGQGGYGYGRRSYGYGNRGFTFGNRGYGGVSFGIYGY